MALLPHLSEVAESIDGWLKSGLDPVLLEGEVGCGKSFIIKVANSYSILFLKRKSMRREYI